MKISVDGNVVTINYEAKDNGSKNGCIMDDCIEKERKQGTKTYRDKFWEYCRKSFNEKIDVYATHGSDWLVETAYDEPFFLGIEAPAALNEFACENGKKLNWYELNDITKWLDTEVEN